MKKVSIYLVPLLLLMVFSLKICLQLAINLQYAEKAIVEQTDGKSEEEKSIDKSSNNITEYLAIFAARPTGISTSKVMPVTSFSMHTSLPVQYFAIPTPPPWHNC